MVNVRNRYVYAAVKGCVQTFGACLKCMFEAWMKGYSKTMVYRAVKSDNPYPCFKQCKPYQTEADNT